MELVGVARFLQLAGVNWKYPTHFFNQNTANQFDTASDPEFPTLEVVEQFIKSLQIH